MKSINTVFKQIQMIKVLSRNFFAQKFQNLTDIDSYENILLIQARIYHALNSSIQHNPLP